MLKLYRTCILLFALALITLPSWAEGAGSREAMADAMLRMMEAMGFIGSEMSAAAGAISSNDAPSAFNPAIMPGWPSAFSPWRGMPLELPDPPSPAAFMPQSGNLDRSMRTANPWGATTPLEGIWESNDGGLLIVQGRFYRIYAPMSGSLDGSLRISADRLELINPRENFSQTFEFAIDQGRLALRDANGQIFLYRRLILDGAATIR